MFSNKDSDNIKLVDFGFAKAADPKSGTYKDSLGTPLYIAPEIIKNEDYKVSVDIWSVGVIAYQMLSGVPPFWGRNKS